MSFDVKLRQTCEHKLFRIPLLFDVYTRRDAYVPYPVGNFRTFTLIVNDTWELLPGDEEGDEYTYDLVHNDLAASSQQMKVKFRKPVRSDGAFFQANFIAVPELCPRCIGYEVESDYRSNGQGGPNILVNEQKLVQQIERAELVQSSSMIFHPRLGTKLEASIGRKSKANSQQSSFLASEVRRALEEYVRLQTSQRKYQTLSLGETLDSIESVSATRDPDDATAWRITVRLRALSGNATVITRTVNEE